MARYSVSEISRLLDESDNAPTADKKGEKLEDLARYLLEKIPGVEFYDRNVLDGQRAHEIDIVFWNHPTRSRISFLDTVLIVEFKNHGTPVSSAQVGWFVRKLQDRGAKSAILISLSGITGSFNEESNAHSEVLNALVRDGIKILILSRSEILRLLNTNDLYDLLKKKLLKLTLNRTIILDIS